jgi:hypothetical protein
LLLLSFVGIILVCFFFSDFSFLVRLKRLNSLHRYLHLLNDSTRVTKYAVQAKSCALFWPVFLNPNGQTGEHVFLLQKSTTENIVFKARMRAGGRVLHLMVCDMCSLKKLWLVLLWLHSAGASMWDFRSW